MNDLQTQLLRLTQNLNILREREARYEGQAPLALLNQIEDFCRAIAWVEQTLAGQLTPAELSDRLLPFNLELPPPVPVPPALALHQLPCPPADFTGRAAELAELTAALEQGGVAISGLRGLGGIGKTALALKLAERLAGRYPDAQFYLDLRGAGPSPLAPAEIMAHVIRAYHPTAKLPEGETELSALYHSVLHGRRALLLLDNAASAAQVEPLLPPPGCLLLVTSRAHFHLPGLYPKNLDTLPPEDACKLLLAIAPRLRPDPAAQIAHLCGYLPLALRLAGRALAERPDLSPETYLRRLADAQKRLALIDASLSLSYDLLNPELQQFWAALSVFPADFNLPAAAAVWDLAPDTADECMGDLLKYSLLEYRQGSEGAGEQGSGPSTSSGTGAGEQGSEFFPPSPLRRGAGGEVRYHLHDLARLFADSRLDPTAHAETQERHAMHYETVYRTATELYKRGSNNTRHGLALFDKEWPNIQAGQAWAEKNTKTNDTGAALCSAYVDWPYLLELRQHPRERICWLEAALAAARRLQDRGMEGVHLGNLGLAYAALGESRRAIEYHEQYLAIAREIGDRRGEGNALWNKALALDKLGERAQAIASAEAALRIYEQIESPYAGLVRQQLAEWRGEGQRMGNE